ncbi:MAG TPA: toll/interleukin-1 receptor domain-containing protein, partial [Candidatus Limnocylindrales bacterium]|nr:toll/interleukin-1 receptor domain-containing protein [Candidatus Limnocylindrales bacterium]
VRSARQTVAKSIREAKAEGSRTAFLCHSHHDKTLVQGLEVLFQDTGWNVYIDWQDPLMPSAPTVDTARRIRDKVAQADFFVVLATANALQSRWCPWEIGIADGLKPHDSILIIPTTSGGVTTGNEYIELYRSIDFSTGGWLGVWPPGQTSGGQRLSDI